MVNQDLLRMIQEGTKVNSPQRYARESEWDYVVYGPNDSGKVVVREGKFSMSPIMIARSFRGGIASVDGERKLEDVVIGDVDFPEELGGMIVLTPGQIMGNKVSNTYVRDASLDTVRGELLARYGNDKVVIQTPHEKYWLISLIWYIHNRGAINCPAIGAFQRMTRKTIYDLPGGIIHLPHI